MRRFSIFIAITGLFILTGIASAESYKKSDAKLEVDSAKILMEQLENNNELKRFIPYKNYYDAKIYLDTAIFQFDEEKEYSIAVYYAVLAMVEIETTLAKAAAQSLRYKKLELERDFYKEMSSVSSRKAMLKIALIDANIQKEGNVYKGVVFDRRIFAKNSFILTDDGKKMLDKIFEVLKMYPASRINIAGHTRVEDLNNTKSMQKAAAVAAYYSTIKGMGARRITTSGLSNTQPMEINKNVFLVDRVEIIISGVK